MRILIVEDEATVASRLTRLLKELAREEITSLEVCPSVEAAELRLESGELDVLFLDLNLNGEDGFTLLENLSSRPFHTVVVSGHTERAMQAFELGVLDFVGKPFGAERLGKTLERMRGARAPQPAANLAVRTPGRIDLVPIASVDYVRASGSYSELILRNGSSKLFSKPLDRLASLLPDNFERIHRSYLVRLDEIVQIRVRKGSRYAALLASGVEVPVGRSRVESLRGRLERRDPSDPEG